MSKGFKRLLKELYKYISEVDKVYEYNGQESIEKRNNEDILNNTEGTGVDVSTAVLFLQNGLSVLW